MKLTIEVTAARLIRHDEIIQHDSGPQVIPAGEVVVTLTDGTMLGFRRDHFEQLSGLVLDDEALTYVEPPVPKQKVAQR